MKDGMVPFGNRISILSPLFKHKKLESPGESQTLHVGTSIRQYYLSYDCPIFRVIGFVAVLFYYYLFFHDCRRQLSDQIDQVDHLIKTSRPSESIHCLLRNWLRLLIGSFHRCCTGPRDCG